MDALDRVTDLLVGFGSRVLVENPTFAPLLDLLELVGAETIPLPLDDEGIRPDALAGALGTEPAALYLQPRAHNPTGVSMTADRARTLAGLLAGRGVTVIEDDHSGDVRSFSKSHGPDLRLAAVGGAASVVDAVATRRLLGPGWSSRLLQAVLAELLVDGAAGRTLADARERYAARRARMVAALAARGVRAQAADGINLWMEVADEQVALVALAARGIGAAPGTPFEAAPLGTDHLRVTVGLVPDDAIEALADILADAAHG
jgi:DNA-binding transcriptional MocR family regulator